MKTKNNSSIKQKAFRSKKFSFDQYWKIQYSLFENKKEESTYISVIKARSFDLATEILFKKIKDESPFLKIKNIRGSMFHKNYHFDRSNDRFQNIINIKDWENIRNCAYPNENNFLFRHLLSRMDEFEIKIRNENKIKNLK